MSRDEMLQHLVVQPEGEPGDHHDHEAGDVDGHQVEGQLTREGQVNLRSNRGNLTLQPPCMSKGRSLYILM